MNAPWTPEIPPFARAEQAPSPVDLDGETAGDALGWTGRSLAAAALFLLLFNAGAVRGWASELPPGPATEPLIAAADRWYDATHAAGLDVPVETMRGWWQRAQAARLTAGETQR